MQQSFLRIGDVASLLGVTRKTIRHYHKLGLLPEPERAENGYRLYSAADLVMLQRIRQLQSIGFSLQRIKYMLDSDESDRLLREALLALCDDIHQQIEGLQARQAQIDTLLQQNITLQKVSVPEGESPIFQLYMEIFGELMNELSPEEMEAERQLWASMEAFHWPGSTLYYDNLRKALSELAARPEAKAQLLDINERFRALADASPDDPEVRRLAEEIVHKRLYLKVDYQSVPMPKPFMTMFKQTFDHLNNQAASPAQQQVIELIREMAKSHP